MAVNFRQRAAALDRQLRQVEADLAEAAPASRLRLQALQASLKRSLRWYRSRAGSRSDIHALRASVGDDVRTSEANA